MFRSNKNSNKYHNYIIVSEKDTGVRNYHFSRKFVLLSIALSALTISTVLFFTANALTGVIHKAKMDNLRSSYEHLSQTLVLLQSQLESVSGKVGSIEEKDQAIRTYAGLPQIDKDVRKLGVGGTEFKTKSEKILVKDTSSPLKIYELFLTTISITFPSSGLHTSTENSILYNIFPLK